jgi:hypothetical protein
MTACSPDLQVLDLFLQALAVGFADVRFGCADIRFLFANCRFGVSYVRCVFTEFGLDLLNAACFKARVSNTLVSLRLNVSQDRCPAAR